MGIGFKMKVEVDLLLQPVVFTEVHSHCPQERSGAGLCCFCSVSSSVRPKNKNPLPPPSMPLDSPCYGDKFDGWSLAAEKLLSRAA